MTKLEQAARQALETLIWTTGSGDFGPGGIAHEGAEKYLYPAITAMREALEENAKISFAKAEKSVEQQVDPCVDGSCSCCWTHLDQQPAEQEPVAWIANDWSVLNTGAEVASGLSLNEAMDYLTDERAARGWSVVCVINKDNDDGDCPLCGGTGEVSISKDGTYEGTDYYGCPVCISREYGEEVRLIKAQRDELLKALKAFIDGRCDREIAITAIAKVTGERA